MKLEQGIYEEYKAKIDLMRRLISDVPVTTDIIAGFSGESGNGFSFREKLPLKTAVANSAR